ncbi:MAG: hypothetical protein R6U94_07735 [Nitriliruptoraceae bacterium]
MDRGHGGSRPPGRSLLRGPHLLLVVLLLVPLAACSRLGEETIRIDEAEQEIVRLTDEIVAAIDLEVTSARTLGRRERCQLVTTDTGAANRVAFRGPIPEAVPVLERAAAILSDAGYQLVPSGREDELFGRRDGLRITVLIDRPAGEVAIDGNTACRPLER